MGGSQNGGCRRCLKTGSGPASDEGLRIEEKGWTGTGSGLTHSGRNRPTRFCHPLPHATRPFWGTSWVWPPKLELLGGYPNGIQEPIGLGVHLEGPYGAGVDWDICVDQRIVAAICQGALKIALRGGGDMDARRRRGGGVGEMGFRVGPFVLSKNGCWRRRRRNTNFGPKKFFPPINQ